MARGPRILIVLHRLGEGGVERVALHLANGLAERGNRVSLLVLRRDGVLHDRLGGSVELIEPPGFANSARGAGLLLAIPRVARAIRDVRPDVLLSPGNHLHPLLVLAHRQAAVGHCRLAIKLTNPVERPGGGRLGNALRRAFFRFAARRADVVLALSAPALDQAARIAPNARLRVVDNPCVDQSLLTPRPSLVHSARPPLLLSVGRLAAQKDPLMLLDAVAGLGTRPWRLAMLGDGPMRPLIEARAGALGIADRIDLPGYVADPAPWFDRARLFLMASRYEELPAVLLEAVAARCPIVATAASGSIVECLGGYPSARIVPAGDADAFRSAVIAALEDPAMPPDPAPWIARFTLGNGVSSHAEALGLA